MIVNTRGPVSYIVKLSDGHHIKCHVDWLPDITVTDQATDSEVADDCIILQLLSLILLSQEVQSILNYHVGLQWLQELELLQTDWHTLRSDMYYL